MMIIGHRGVPSETPRNTLAGLRRAIELGLDYVELDLRTTRDGKIVDIHNATVDDTTNGKGEIAAMTLAEIRRLDAGSWFSPEFRGERIPLFVEELALAKGRIKLYLDMKAVDPLQVLWLLQQFDMVGDAVCFSSPNQLEEMQDMNPAVQVMPHLGRAEDIAALAQRLHPHYVERGAGPLDQAAIDAAHAHGAKYFLDIQGAGDNEEHILACLRAGVDAVQTDHPQLVIDVLRRTGLERPAAGPAPGPPPIPARRADARRVKIIAHRGVAKRAPQNTLASSRAAIAMGLDYIEVDVQTTADGLMIDMHNDSVDRVTNGHGLVKELTYQQIRALDAGSWFAPQFKGEHVPLLGEVLALAKDRIGIYVDWKNVEVGPLVRLLQAFDMTRDVLIHGSVEECEAVRAMDPTVPLMPGARSIEDVLALAKGRCAACGLHPQAVEVAARTFTKEAVRACHDNGMLCATSLAGGRGDDPENMRRVIAAGVDLIETDNPEVLLEVLKSFP
jgi:glycerophosphoryl diester phosphodiesterase